MKQSLLIAALLAFAISGCAKKEEAVPEAAPAAEAVAPAPEAVAPAPEAAAPAPEAPEAAAPEAPAQN